jgi:hypothetical protein
VIDTEGVVRVDIDRDDTDLGRRAAFAAQLEQQVETGPLQALGDRPVQESDSDEAREQGKRDRDAGSTEENPPGAPNRSARHQ